LVAFDEFDGKSLLKLSSIAELTAELPGHKKAPHPGVYGEVLNDLLSDA
jgi:hypothetical protein